MAKDKYEISLWIDKEKSNGYYEEQKVAVIGSDTMTSPCRALEPKLVENINGTNTFTFKMFYLYDISDIEEARARGTLNSDLTWVTDDKERNKYRNPFENLLVNERKVKVFWKDKWYDLVIKNIQEDSSGRSVIYTCKDLFINELSKTGFDLEFDNELENNQGTASELAQKVLEGTDWQFVSGDTIQQEKEEPVFEAEVITSFKAQNQSKSNATETISAATQGEPPTIILVYYQQVQDYLASNTSPTSFQFAYASKYKQDTNSQLVVNADCYVKNNIQFTQVTEGNIDYIYIKVKDTIIAKFVQGAISTNYRASRLVQSQICKLDPLTGKYCYVYKAKSNNGDNYSKDDEIYMYRSTEYKDATFVNDLIVNGSGFTTTEGWYTENSANIPVQRLHPDYDKTITWSPTALLKLVHTTYINYGIRQNSNFIPEGFKAGEQYILRIKGRQSGVNDVPTDTYLDAEHFYISPKIQDKDGTSYFKNAARVDGSDHWIEYKLTCVKSITRAEIYSKELNLYITPNRTIWMEGIQLYPLIYAGDDNNPIRIDPGAYDIESVAKVYYFYYNHTKSQSLINAEDINYLYTDTKEWQNSQLEAQYNDNFEKIRSINAKQTNRFNILQSIAETFECWVRFNIEHDNTGKIIYDNGIPRKYVSIVKEIGQQTGIGFVYGVDLKTISRTIKSDQIVTKTIVPQNSNEFGLNGFCTIARSEQNYPRTNFILNFDYYITHDLINSSALNRDLYLSVQNPNSSTNRNKPNAYYFSLNLWNTQYDSNIEWIANKRTELEKQQSYLTVYQDTLIALKQRKVAIENELTSIAGTTSWNKASNFLEENKEREEVKTRLASRASVMNQITLYNGYIKAVSSSVKKLEKAIASKEKTQERLLQYIKEKNFAFYKKYSRFIQEGTWKSEEYIDDNLYYLDAQSVAYTSSRPQIEYNISVLRLSSLEEYKNKVFKLGDIAYIQDTEFFGYIGSGVGKTPYKEQVLVSEITSNFDEPEKDSFKIQNYKTQFEDLFQRITSTTQSLQYAEGAYSKAASIVEDNGTIKYDTLQNSFSLNEQLVISAKNETVFSDSTGLTVASTIYPNNKVKITSGGIFITTDGGLTWKSGVRGNGLSTENLAAGAISANNINIVDKNYSTFRWDSQGINAFWIDEQGINTSRFIRYDHYGIYGIGNISNFNPEVETNGKIGEEKIWDKASVGITWHGFFLKNSDGTGSVQITSDQDIRVLTGSGNNEIERIKIGRLYSDGEKGYEVVTTYISGQTYYIKSGPTHDGPWFDIADTRIWKSNEHYYIGGYELTNLFEVVNFNSSFTAVTNFDYRPQNDLGYYKYGGIDFLIDTDYYVYENDSYRLITEEEKADAPEADVIYYTRVPLPEETIYYKEYGVGYTEVTDAEKRNSDPLETYYIYGIPGTGGFDSTLNYYVKDPVYEACVNLTTFESQTTYYEIVDSQYVITEDEQPNPQKTYYVISSYIYHLVTSDNPVPGVEYYTFDAEFDSEVTYYNYTDGGYIVVDINESTPQYGVNYYVFNANASDCYTKDINGNFNAATTPLNPNVEYYTLEINNTPVETLVEQPSRNETYYVSNGGSSYREAIASDFDEGFIRNVTYYKQTSTTAYGIRISNRNGDAVMETASDGTLWLKKALYIGADPNNIAHNVSIGYLDASDSFYESYANLQAFDPSLTYYEKINGSYEVTSDSTPAPNKIYYVLTEEHEVFNSNNNFIVYENGSIIANDGVFTGIINATGGSFSGVLEAATGRFIGEVVAGSGYFGSESGSVQISDTGLIAADGSSIIIEGGTFEMYSNPVYEPYDSSELSSFSDTESYYIFTNGHYEIISEEQRTLGPQPGVTYYSKNRGERIFYFDKDTNLLNAIGHVEATSGYFAGELRAKSGYFYGTIQASDGIIGGWRIFDNKLASTEKTIANGVHAPFEPYTGESFQPGITYYTKNGYTFTPVENPVSGNTYYQFIDGYFVLVDNEYQKAEPNRTYNNETVLYVEEQGVSLNGATGLIEADRIRLGTGATIKEYIHLGDRVKLLNADADVGGRYLIVSNDNDVETIIFRDDASIQLGAVNGILLDGKTASINGGENTSQYFFNITPEQATFNNIVASGKFTATIFEQGKVQAVGGTMVFKPSFKIIEWYKDTTTNTIILTLEEDIGVFVPTDYEPYDPQPTGSFIAEKEYFEYDETNNEYFETSDTVPDPLKTYFKYNLPSYIDLVYVNGLKTVKPLEVTRQYGIADNKLALYYDDNSEEDRQLWEAFEAGQVSFLILIGLDGDLIVGANSNNIFSGFLRPRGFTIAQFNKEATPGQGVFSIYDPQPTESFDPTKKYYEYNSINGEFSLTKDSDPQSDHTYYEKSSDEYTIKAFLGDMDAAKLFGDSTVKHGFGLYTENAFLNGSLTTRVRNRDVSSSITYAGVNTLDGTLATKFDGTMVGVKEDHSSIVFWAGAASERSVDIQNAPFQVTEEGSLYASQGYFEGSIITRSEIRGADIYAARIHGIGKDEDGGSRSYGLAFFDIDNGIVFYRDGDIDKREGTDTRKVGSEVFRIGTYGLAIYDSANNNPNYFIKIATYTPTAGVSYVVPYFFGFNFLAINPYYTDAAVLRHNGVYWTSDKNNAASTTDTIRLEFSEDTIFFRKTGGAKYFEIDIKNQQIKSLLKTTYVDDILLLKDKMSYEPHYTSSSVDGYDLYIR